MAVRLSWEQKLLNALKQQCGAFTANANAAIAAPYAGAAARAALPPRLAQRRGYVLKVRSDTDAPFPRPLLVLCKHSGHDYYNAY